MLNCQNENYMTSLTNVENDPVIANSITPKPVKLMTQGLAEAARIFFSSYPGVHVLQDVSLHFPGQFPSGLSSTRGSYSTVQAKVFAQLTRTDAGLRVRKAVYRHSSIFGSLFITIHNEIPQVIRQRYTARLCCKL